MCDGNGKYIVSSSDDTSATVWETATGQEVSSMNHNDTVHTAVFSPDGTYVVSGGLDGIAIVWEVATGQSHSRVCDLRLSKPA